MQFKYMQIDGSLNACMEKAVMIKLVDTRLNSNERMKYFVESETLMAT